jgi:branched-chain amino acid transport system substrate-binding protein
VGLPRRSLTRLLPAVLALAAIAGCARQQEITPPWPTQPRLDSVPPPAPPPPRTPPTVGLLLPLSGQAARLGADLLDAAQLALFDVGDATLQLVPRDTGDTPEGAVAAAHAAVDAGAELLLGPLFRGSTAAVAPVAAARNVSVLSFSNDAGVAGRGVYVLGFRPEEQVARVVEYAGRRGLTRFAALAPDDAYGSVAVAAWRNAIRRVPGGVGVGVERYGARQGDAAAAVQALAGGTATPADGGAPAAASGPLPFDSLLIADGGPRLRAVIETLPAYGVAGAGSDGGARLLGTMRWQDDASVLAEPAAQGAWIAAWPPTATARFAARFREAYGRAPDPLAVLAYDGTALASLLGKADARFGAAQLTDPQGFTGGSGLFRLRPDGATEHGLAVLEVRGGTTREIDPAPTSFPAGFAAR